jgi:hypothetical protein
MFLVKKYLCAVLFGLRGKSYLKPLEHIRIFRRDEPLTYHVISFIQNKNMKYILRLKKIVLIY